MASENSLTNILSDPKSGEQLVVGTKFRLANQKILLTYKGHLEKLPFKDWLYKLVTGYVACEMAHETGMSNDVPYEHTHILVDFGRNFQTTNVRFFDYKDTHPNIKKVKNRTHWDRCLNYLAKEDPENAHLKTKPAISSIVWGSDSLHDAIKTGVTKAGDVMGVKMLWDLRPSEPIVREYSKYSWQEELIEELKGVPDRRHVIWYVDLQGGGGKSELCEYLMATDKNYWMTGLLGGPTHAATQFQNASDAGWKGHCYFIDLPRDAENKAIYEPIEMLKNGTISTTKYSGKTTQLPYRPHVVVFSNFYPNVDKLSKDRWDIRILERLAPEEVIQEKIPWQAVPKAKGDNSEPTILTIL